jgi:hypothetical protein
VAGKRSPDPTKSQGTDRPVRQIRTPRAPSRLDLQDALSIVWRSKGSILGTTLLMTGVALGAEVVDLIRLEIEDQRDATRSRTGRRCAWKTEVPTREGRLVVVEALRVERGRPTDQPVHLIALAQEEFRQVGPVLPTAPVTRARS